jgi:mono/diheme cytochrome c family protein
VKRLRSIVVRLVAAIVVAGFALAARADSDLSGPELWDAACASCHGADGRGAAEGSGVTVPLPDFADCSFNTREPESDWAAVVLGGGPVAGLSSQMPAFRDSLGEEDVARVLAYVRGFCDDDRWPRGELNFRRLLVTSKAFPENEAVLEHRSAAGPRGALAHETRAVYERRVGARGQVEVAVPVVVRDAPGDEAHAGAGDVSVGYKHVLIADLAARHILSASLELALPSGDRQRGLGDDTVTFEPALHVGQQMGPVVLQGQVKGLAPVDDEKADRGVRWRLGASLPLGPTRRDWVPSVEWETFQNVTARDETHLVVPQIYKAIRRRGHVALAAGVQLPVGGGPRPFDYRVVAFLLWEYADGGLWW